MNNALKIVFFSLFPLFTFGQLPLVETGEGLMRREVYGGLTLATNGWGINFHYAKQKNYKYKYLYGIHIGNIRHEKETKSYTSVFEDAKGYYYGKLNSVLTFRPFYGGKRILFEKTRSQGVEINFIWSVGVSLALVKPTYLKIKKFNEENSKFETVEEQYDPSQHHPENIFGRSSWFKGFGGTKLSSGLFMKYGCYFDLSARRLNLWGVEIGAMADIYLERLPIMHNSKNHFIFPSLYANIMFGRKLM